MSLTQQRVALSGFQQFCDIDHRGATDISRLGQHVAHVLDFGHGSTQDAIVGTYAGNKPDRFDPVLDGVEARTMRLDRKLARWIRNARVIRRIAPRPGSERVRVDHVIILDGTNSSLVPGEETNAGILYKLIRETAPSAHLNLHYEAGIAWDNWHSTMAVISGNGINGRIMRAYGAIASRYQPGDRIFLFGFSRGAYAVRSLAGIIGMVGLLKGEHATVRNVQQVFRHYEHAPTSATAKQFAKAYCRENLSVEMVGVWDTVKSLGFRAPFIWRLTEGKYRFHNHALGEHVKNGFQALALDENRVSFSPVLWETPANLEGKMEQVWFRGTHGDIGGQLKGFNEARPRSNIALCWLVRKVAMCGVELPEGWEKRFEVDPLAPSARNNRGWSRAFLARRKRIVGRDASETMHPSVVALAESGGKPAPDLPVTID